MKNNMKTKSKSTKIIKILYNTIYNASLFSFTIPTANI